MVPLHGRLFAQWLHYVFPHECPFPHKNGAVSASTPMEFGANYVATKVGISMHITGMSKPQTPNPIADCDESNSLEHVANN